MVKNIVLFASGAGSNVNNVCTYFANSATVKVVAIIGNTPQAGVIQVAAQHQVPFYLVSKKELNAIDFDLEKLVQAKIDVIVLAGFLLLIPIAIIQKFPNKIINLHPSLLPKYGGKGMYGMQVHQAVIAAHEPLSGITIHYVNAEYDKGEILLQATCAITKEDTPESLAQKIHQLEMEHLPKAIARVVENK